MHFGGSLASNDLNEVEASAGRANLGAPHLHDEHHFRSHVLHADFTLLTANYDSGHLLDERLTAALQHAGRKHHMGELIVVDMPTNMRLAQKDISFDIELEIIAAEPASISAACHRHQSKNVFKATSGLAHGHYVIINKKDLRSELSRDAAVMAESLFGESVISCIHYDAAVSEALAHKSLLNDYAPHSQAAMDIDELSRTIANVLKLGSDKEKDSA